MPLRIRSLAQRRAIAIALKKLGKLRQAPKAVGEFGAAAKTVTTGFFTETLPGIGLKKVGQGILQAPLVTAGTSAAKQAMPENVRKLGQALFGHRGALGQVVGKLRRRTIAFQRSSVRAPGTKIAAGVGVTALEEGTKVAGQMTRQAIESFGNTPTGQMLVGSHRVAKNLLRSPLPTVRAGAPSPGLRPHVGSIMRDIRGTRGITGRLGLKLKRRIIDPKIQGLREFIHTAIGGKRTPYSAARTRTGLPSEITIRRRQAMAQIQTGLAAQSATRAAIRNRPGGGGVRAAGGISAVKKQLRAAQGNIEKGLEAHREIRRTVRHRGLEDIPVLEPALAGVGVGIVGGKWLQRVSREMKQERARKQAREDYSSYVEDIRNQILARDPFISPAELQERVLQRQQDRAFVTERIRERRQARLDESVRRALEREAKAEDRAAAAAFRLARSRKADREQSRSPRESTLGVIRSKISRLGALLGTKKQTPKKRRKRR